MPDIEARGLHFGLKIEAPPHFVHADAARLQQVFWNLLKNSVKFTPHGGCIGVRCWREGETLIVEVTDSGEGIESEAAARIFNAFEQAERNVTRRFGGLGLGLSISKALVELHGGTIEARSSGKGRGATFTVRLPVVYVPGMQPPTRQAEEEKKAERSLRILLVEDHGDTAQIMRQYLNLEGHAVDVAGDVATALERTREKQYDLLISDIGLPDATGVDLIRELRARGVAMPAIAISGYGMEQDVARSKEAGFAAHITKPANPARLAEAIAQIAHR